MLDLETQPLLFFHLLREEHDPDRWTAILEATFTQAELAMIWERWRIFAALRQGLSHRQIAAKLGCGVATVTRGAKAYRTHQSLINELLVKIPPALLSLDYHHANP